MLRNEDIFSRNFTILVISKTEVGTIPQTSKQAMWLIEYTIRKEKYTNHYLARKAPFKLTDYQNCYKKLNIKRD